MKHSLPVKDTIIIGFMLFALFFGAVNIYLSVGTWTSSRTQRLEGHRRIFTDRGRPAASRHYRHRINR